MITQVDLGSTTLTTTKRLLQAVKNLTFPEVNITALRRGSFPGQKVSFGKPAGYKFALEWAIVGDTFSDLATQRETFLKLFGEIIKDGTKTLKINKSNSVNVQIDVMGVKVAGEVQAEDGNASKLLIELTSEYPYLMSQTLQSFDVFIFNGGGMAIPMALPMNMSINGANEATLSNAGNIEAYPVFTFYGPLNNPSIQNVTTGKQLSLNYNLTSADYIVVDVFNRTVNLYISGAQNNGRRYASGDFWTMQPGNNLIHLNTGTFNASGKCKVEWRDHYLGI